MASGSEGRRPRLALATCAEVAELDAEGRLLLDELRAAGIAAEPTVWDDPSCEWERYERVLLRSTWDYPGKHAAFAAWVAERGEQLLNPAPIVAWNLNKRYLSRVADWGFPIVPSRFLGPGQPIELPAEGEFVVKPVISAGSRDTARYRQADRARAGAHVATLLAAGREVLVQPYLGSVETAAETAVVVLGGRVSHAVRKGPMLELDQELEPGLFRPERIEAREPEPEEAELAAGLLERVARELGPPLYGRVDLLRSETGEPRVLELELIEPSLFLDRHPPGAARLARLLRSRLER